MVTTRLANMPTSIRLLLMPTNHAGCMMYESGPGRRSFFGMNGLTCGRVLSSVFLCQLNVFQVYFIYRSHKCTCVCKFSMKRERESSIMPRREQLWNVGAIILRERHRQRVYIFARRMCACYSDSLHASAENLARAQAEPPASVQSHAHTHTHRRCRTSLTDIARRVSESVTAQEIESAEQMHLISKINARMFTVELSEQTR